MDFIGFVIGLFVGVPVGCALMAVIAAGAGEDREIAGYQRGHETGYRKGMTDWTDLGER